ncbi:MAG TPA: ATP-binding protein [Gaiellaceae bacterium]|nr:ATP-binding protein [Gaiellaceae bacterium]
MHHDRFMSLLWGEILLFALFGASLALYLAYPDLQTPYDAPQLKLALQTVFMLTGGLVAVLSATRFSVEGRRFDIFLFAGFFTTSLSLLVFAIVPTVGGFDGRPTEYWASIVGTTVGWGLIAVAPLAHGHVARRGALIVYAMATGAAILGVVWVGFHLLGSSLPTLTASDTARPAPLSSALASLAFVLLVAVVGFTNRFRRSGEDLERWLALGGTLMLYATLDFMLMPPARVGSVSLGDYLQLAAYGVLLVGAWRAIRAAEFGRAVAEERGRLAREIHDGLAQYLFAVASHASMLETGADPETTLPRLKEAAQAAQQEARYAFLALSSAAGRSPFDAALRRYVEFLAADGTLDVQLVIDPKIVLRPDEQIELFRIVQEGLANARKHAGARTARVEIGTRAGARFVEVRDDGDGFEPEEGGAGQGLANMRERAASIGGNLSLRTAPRRGTCVEVVLRA